MQRPFAFHRTLVSFTTLLFLLAAAFSPFVFVNRASAATQDPYISLSRSFTSAPAGARLLGHHASTGQLTISVVLQPRNAAQMNAL